MTNVPFHKVSYGPLVLAFHSWIMWIYLESSYHEDVVPKKVSPQAPKSPKKNPNNFKVRNINKNKTISIKFSTKPKSINILQITV